MAKAFLVSSTVLVVLMAVASASATVAQVPAKEGFIDA